jgi:hypothetical protein
VQKSRSLDLWRKVSELQIPLPWIGFCLSEKYRAPWKKLVPDIIFRASISTRNSRPKRRVRRAEMHRSELQYCRVEAYNLSGEPGVLDTGL